jgi:hypothetical protein
MYMQWYQPLDQKMGYRTMVNSYLTLLVEQGWPVFALGVAGVCLLWNWVRPQMEKPTWAVAVALRAALIALAVAGIFSTVWEDSVVWGSGLALVVCLGAIAAFNRQRFRSKEALTALAWAGGFCAVLALGGWLVGRNDPWKREFVSYGGDAELSRIEPRQGGVNAIYLTPDHEVLGDATGRLLRRLSLASGREIIVTKAPDDYRAGENDFWLVAGEGVKQLPKTPNGKLVLLMPSKIDPAEAGQLLADWKTDTIFLPGIDSDGRANFWRNAAADMPPTKTHVITLNNVGLRASWGWDEIIETLR